MIIEIDVIEKLSKEIDFLYSELSEDQQEYQGFNMANYYNILN